MMKTEKDIHNNFQLNEKTYSMSSSPHGYQINESFKMSLFFQKKYWTSALVYTHLTLVCPNTSLFLKAFPFFTIIDLFLDQDLEVKKKIYIYIYIFFTYVAQ
ncbi:hypothetical protein XELAEV_18005736mg [Xenopus laevis]|uniref:Uncharacterized protein n=1 Tax=Xenopus laevis TaxID=8355 RepID=A0A974DY70_XENLA|nr:hypothetical protein XELAEV_18005736mg [Xenopus laevis]